MLPTRPCPHPSHDRVLGQVNEPLGEDELVEMIELGDLDGDGAINDAEFIRLMVQTNLFRL